jgi:hypothetical protein
MQQQQPVRPGVPSSINAQCQPNQPNMGNYPRKFDDYFVLMKEKSRFPHKISL